MIVLVVEDEIDLADVIRYILEAEGEQVMLAGDGREAIKRLEERRPDVVLTDLMMPFMSGHELARFMESDERFKEIPVVAMTAAPDSVQPGDPFAAVVHKPFDMDKLLDLLRRVVVRH